MRRVPDPRWICCWLLAFSVCVDSQTSVGSTADGGYDLVVSGILFRLGFC